MNRRDAEIAEEALRRSIWCFIRLTSKHYPQITPITQSFSRKGRSWDRSRDGSRSITCVDLCPICF